MNSNTTSNQTDTSSERAENTNLKRAEDLFSLCEKALKKSEKKTKNLTKDLEECNNSEKFLQTGELIKANLATIKRGTTSIVVRDFFSKNADATREIRLDPARPAKETMQKLFKKAAKLERGKEKIKEQIEISSSHTNQISKLIRNTKKLIEQGNIPDESLGRLESDCKKLKIISNAVLKEKTSRPLSKKEQIRQKLMKSVRIFTSHDGIEILVGKSNTDNDILSFRLARGNDWWMHLSPAAGSHVVIRHSSGMNSLPQETMLDAATLAVYFSKMRTATQADVTFTNSKYIRRIKGAPPGKVRVERSKTIRVRIEPERLERLLKNK